MMFENVKWLFFDVGSTLMNEEKAYEHRMRDMAEAAVDSLEEWCILLLDRGDLRNISNICK